jgi:hypothetical protein
VEPTPEMGDDAKRVSNLKAVFNGLLLRFIMFHPLQKEEEVMCITGGHPSFGSWGKPEAWCRMGLGGVRTLLTHELGRCWEATFPATMEDVHKVAYRYIILNDQTKTAVWESEPNRFLDAIPGASSHTAFEVSEAAAALGARWCCSLLLQLVAALSLLGGGWRGTDLRKAVGGAGRWCAGVP